MASRIRGSKVTVTYVDDPHSPVEVDPDDLDFGMSDHDKFARKMAAKRAGKAICIDCGEFDDGRVAQRDGLGYDVQDDVCAPCRRIRLSLEPEFMCSLTPTHPCHQQRSLTNTWCPNCVKAVNAKLVVPTSRGSGRTLNQLMDAISRARESHAYVIFVVPDNRFAGYCVDLLRKHGVIQRTKGFEVDGRLKFNGGGSLGFENLDKARTMESRWRHMEDRIIYDHSIADRRPGAVLGQQEQKRPDHLEFAEHLRRNPR